MTKSEQILAFARKHVGKPYKLGGRGPDVWDCSGLTKMAVKEVGFDWYHGATTQWNRGLQEGRADQFGYWADSGGIDTLPENKMAFLFNRDKDRPGVMAHTGIYDGQGRVVQAGGWGGKGVHDNPINKSRWSHWATLKGAEEEVEVSTEDLRFGSRGEAVRQLQEALMSLGYDVGKNTKADGIFGAATEAGVKSFQKGNGLSVTGVWTDADQEALDALLLPPEEPEDPAMPIDRAALLEELEGINRRLSVIISALKGGD